MTGLLIGVLIIAGTGLSAWCYALLVAAFIADVILSEVL